MPKRQGGRSRARLLVLFLAGGRRWLGAIVLRHFSIWDFPWAILHLRHYFGSDQPQDDDALPLASLELGGQSEFFLLGEIIPNGTCCLLCALYFAMLQYTSEWHWLLYVTALVCMRIYKRMVVGHSHMNVHAIYMFEYYACHRQSKT